MSDDGARDRVAVQRLARRFPLMLRAAAGAGLLWEAARHVCVGEVVLRAPPYAAIVCQPQKLTVCHACFK
jgi:hypothetical protein